MDYSDIFLKSIQDKKQFDDAMKIVRDNSKGDIWLIGGFVYRSIVSQLYGIPKLQVDYDFIVETTNEIRLPNNWELKYNRYGNPKFSNNTYNIDLVSLKNVHSIIRRGIEPTIENYLSGTPLTIQSIAYDCINKKVVGDIGIKAIQDKVVGINDFEQAIYYASKKEVSLKELIINKAESLGFRAILPVSLG